MKISKENFLKTSDDAYIYFEDIGKGIPIVMVPGFLCTTRFFDKNVAELSKRYRVITMDPRGQGNSSKTPGGNTIKRNARDIKELIDYLKLDAVFLMGWSVAASVAVTYAVDFSEYKLAGLILVDGSLYPFSGEKWNHHRGKGYDLENWFATYLPLIYEPQTFYDKFAERISNHGQLPEADRQWICQECKKTMPWTAMENHFDFCQTDNVSNLCHITVPVSIFGSDSKAYGLDMVDEYIRRLPGYAESNKFYESGHLMFYYESEKFNRCMESFVEKVTNKTY